MPNQIVEDVDNVDAEAKRFKSPVRSSEEGWKFDANPTYCEAVFSEEWKAHKPDAYHEYRKDWEEVPRNKIELKFPIHLDIETTTWCNLKCPFCERTELLAASRMDGNTMMSREEYKDIIDQATAAGVRSIKLSFLGEPLLHKDVIWQVQYAKEKGVIDVTMNSNSTALTEKIGRELLEAGLDGFYVSLDAVNPRLYEQQRVGASLGKVIDNVYRFITLRNQIRPSCQVRIGMIMYDDPKWRAQFEAMKVIWDGVADSVAYLYYVAPLADMAQDYPKIDGFHCPQPFQRMFLRANGNVIICCFDGSDSTVVGNWRQMPLSDIWNGKIYRTLRQLHACGQYEKVDMCRKCYVPMTHKLTDTEQAK